eukprot:g3382.t1
MRGLTSSLFSIERLQLLIFLIASIFPCSNVVAKRVTGTLDTDSSFAFLTRFCFEPSAQDQPNYIAFQYNISFPRNATPAIAVYYDHDDQWNAVQNIRFGAGCREKREIADTSGNTFYLNPKGGQVTANMKALSDDEEGLIMASGGVRFISSRPRWYYFVLTDCNGGGKCSSSSGNCQRPLLSIKYDILMLNNAGPLEAFSFDEKAILPMTTVFFVMYCFWLPILGKWMLSLQKKGFNHHTSRLLAGIIIFRWMGLLLSTINLNHFAQAGYDIWSLKFYGDMAEQTSEMLTMLFIILIGKGWTVVRRKISPNGRAKIAAFMASYWAASLGLLLWNYDSDNMEDEQNVVYKYESQAGLLLVWLRVFALIWLLYALQTTFANYNSKKKFFFVFGALSITWILSLPLMFFMASGMELWYRAQVVFGLSYSINFIYEVFIFVLFLPNCAPKFFPFHRKTADMTNKGTDFKDGKRRSSKGRRGSRSAMGADAISGGSIIADPAERMRELISNARKKVQLQFDYLEQMEGALIDMVGDAEPEEDEDFDNRSEEPDLERRGSAQPSASLELSQRRSSRASVGSVYSTTSSKYGPTAAT